MKVLLLGADGFIDRHIALHLRHQGIAVTAPARNPARLAAAALSRVLPASSFPALRAPTIRARRGDLARTTPPGHPLPPAVTRPYHIWFALGCPAFAALVAVFWLMVSKPDLGL